METMATGEGPAAKAPVILEAILLLGVTLALATTFIGLYAVPGTGYTKASHRPEPF